MYQYFITRCLLVLGTLFSIIAASPAQADLRRGDIAPDFSRQASLGGKEFQFSLYDALKHGPVVVYFFPAAFTSGCTLEAHAFAEATDDFKTLGAIVIGVSHDKIETLNKFSASECRNKFAVAADTEGSIIKSYDAGMVPLMKFARRTSYVILPDHTILSAYSAMNPAQHVTNTLEALRKWHREQIPKEK